MYNDESMTDEITREASQRAFWERAAAARAPAPVEQPAASQPFATASMSREERAAHIAAGYPSPVQYSSNHPLVHLVREGDLRVTCRVIASLSSEVMP